MHYVHLGQSGLEVSRICLGTLNFGTPAWRAWMLDEAAARPLFRQAVELGITFFDTADTYSGGESEVVTGRLLAQFFPGSRREEAVIATKVFNPVDLAFEGDAAAAFERRPNKDGLGRKRILHAVDASLQRLGVDYIDLYQIHRFDPHTPLEETLEALHDVVKAGKVRYLGASSMWAWQFAKLQQTARAHGWSGCISMQNHYNLVYREEEREMIPLCRDQGVALLPWSPLARGFLAATGTGAAPSARAAADATTERFYGRAEDLATRARLHQMAADKGVSAATLAYAWLLHQGVAAPVVGASQPQQLEQAVRAISVTLTPQELAELGSGYAPRPVLGHS